MASLVFADNILNENFDDFSNWESYPHWGIEDGIAYTDRNAVLVSNNLSLENYNNCTLFFDYKQGENDTRIGLYNTTLDEYEYVLYPENNDWSYLEYFFEEDDFLSLFAKLKIQTQFKEGMFYLDNVSLECLPQPEPSPSSTSGGGGRYHPHEFHMPSVDFGSSTGAEVAYTFSTLPLNKREEFASMIPMSFISENCDGGYEFCSYAVEEPTELKSNPENLFYYVLILLGLNLYVRRKR